VDEGAAVAKYSIRYHDGSHMVPFGSDLLLPSSFTVLVEGSPYTVLADVIVDTDSGPHFTSVTLQGEQPVTPDTWRAVTLGSLLNFAVELAAVTRLRDREGQPLPWEMGDASFASKKELQRAAAEVAGPRRRWLMTDEHLAEVARVYAENPRNIKGRRAPTEAVRDHFNVPTSTAGRWVKRARRDGFLPPASPGRAGGQLTPKAKKVLDRMKGEAR
jgi:hypothetical protein